MNETTTVNRPSPILFLVLSIFAIIAFGYLASRQHNDYVTLTINNEWRIYLMGEDRIDAVKYHIGRFREIRHNSHHLWLHGEGEIHWLKNVIQVHKAGIYLNNKLFTRFFREQHANIQFMTDGKAHRGKPGNNPPTR